MMLRRDEKVLSSEDETIKSKYSFPLHLNFADERLNWCYYSIYKASIYTRNEKSYYYHYHHLFYWRK